MLVKWYLEIMPQPPPRNKTTLSGVTSLTHNIPTTDFQPCTDGGQHSGLIL